MTERRAFLLWFVETLAVAGAMFFAWTRGVPQTIWANDASMMTSAIGALFVVTAAWLGWQAWLSDSPPKYLGLDGYGRRIEAIPGGSLDFGHNAERWCVMLGFVGTAIGLSMQAKSLSAGATSFVALATSLFTTASGGTAALLIGVMTYSLEVGIRRSRR